MEPLAPKDHRERIALFRHSLIAQLLRRDFSHGDLATELRRLSKVPHRPPNSPITRTFSPTTLERWYYAYKRGGLAALVPRVRKDQGRARILSPKLRELLLAIRREHPTASVPLILRTLVRDGRLEAGQISATADIYPDPGTCWPQEA